MRAGLSALSIIGLIGACAGQAGAEPAPYRPLRVVLDEINAGFICPQFLPDTAARQASLQNFGAALATVGPRRVSAADAERIYRRIIQLHNCTGDADAIAIPPSISVSAPGG